MFNNFYTGLVVSIDDPLKRSRVSVRILGHHSEAILDEKLPWAQVMMPNTNASSPTSTDSHGLTVDTWVICASKESLLQDIVVLGTFKGKDDTHLRELGIDGMSIPKEHSAAQARPTGVPANPYKAVYPHNKIHATTSGHIVEYDDTPGAERIYIYHKSGSFIELSNDEVTHVNNGNKWTVTTGNESLQVNGTTSINSTGAISITSDASITITSSSSVTINGSSVSIPNLVVQHIH